MPQHKSAAKRARQNVKIRERNRLHRSRVRTMMKKLQTMEDPSAAQALLSDVKASLDRMATKGLIHKNQAANYKSQLEKRVNTLN